MELVDVTADNWRAVAALDVRAEQREFVAATTYYLCLCHYGQVWHPLAIVVDDTVIGFVMWAVDDSDGSHWIGGLVIDAAQQRRGYGREAIRLLIDRLKAEPNFREVALSYAAHNPARALYAAIGFVETGETEDDELVARLSVAT
jgi:diamine N-acetyltransferase